MKKYQAGLTVVELMISMALGLFLLGMMLNAALGTKQSATSQKSLSRLQEAGRIANDFLTKDIRMASSYGYTHGNGIVNLNADFGQLNSNYTAPIVGYSSIQNFPGGAGAINSPQVISGTENIILIRRTGDYGFIVNSKNQLNKLFAYTTEAAVVNHCVKDLCEGNPAIISDASKSRLIHITALSINQNQLTIEHDGGWGGNDNDLTGVFLRGTVYAVQTKVYFIAKSPDQPGNGINWSLWCKTNNDTPVELVDGIEKLSLQYLTPQNDAAVTADNVSDWTTVNSVFLAFVARDTQSTLESQQQIAFNVDTSDKNLRKVFNSTVTVRSRLN